MLHWEVYRCNGMDFISSGLNDKDHTLRKVRSDRSHSRDRDKLHGVKSPAGSEPGKGKGKGPGVKKVPNKSSSATSTAGAASGKTVTQTKTKGTSPLPTTHSRSPTQRLYTLLYHHQIFISVFPSSLHFFFFCSCKFTILSTTINIW